LVFIEWKTDHLATVNEYRPVRKDDGRLEGSPVLHSTTGILSNAGAFVDLANVDDSGILGGLTVLIVWGATKAKDFTLVLHDSVSTHGIFITGPIASRGSSTSL
jgi:hypothetical protein